MDAARENLRRYWWLRYVLLGFSLVVLPNVGLAQQPPNSGKALDDVVLAMLIKSTLVAVQHANVTGNYSVLRDLGTSAFRDNNDQARLTAIFSNLRGRGLNLNPVLMLLPYLSRPPEFTPQGQLRLVGYFATQPLRIEYDLLFAQTDGTWRIDGIDVNAVPQENNKVISTAKDHDPASWVGVTTKAKTAPSAPPKARRSGEN